MCGIAGYIGSRKFSITEINKILSIMARRGPDSNGYKLIKKRGQDINCFFSRLSILDNKKRSDQPYVYKDKVLIFNGEIYNYLELKSICESKGAKFKTTSDTEVLLKMLNIFGTEAFKMLDGDWAFSYYDKKKIPL